MRNFDMILNVGNNAETLCRAYLLVFRLDLAILLYGTVRETNAWREIQPLLEAQAQRVTFAKTRMIPVANNTEKTRA